MITLITYKFIHFNLIEKCEKCEVYRKFTFPSVFETFLMKFHLERKRKHYSALRTKTNENCDCAELKKVVVEPAVHKSATLKSFINFLFLLNHKLNVKRDFVTNSDFLIHISLSPIVVDLIYFKL